MSEKLVLPNYDPGERWALSDKDRDQWKPTRNWFEKDRDQALREGLRQDGRRL